MNLHIAAIYTLFGRRAGAEMFFEKTVETIRQLFPELRWTVFCNQEAEAVLSRIGPRLEAVRIPLLDNQFRKAFWLECLAGGAVDARRPDVFWNPSGCNYFPGRWRCPTVTTFLDLGEYHIAGKYDWVRMLFRKRICIPRSVRRSVAFTTISQFTADDLGRFLGVRENVFVVHPGPATHRPEHQADAAAALFPRFGLKPGRYFFVPGRTDYIGKGLDLILAVRERLEKNWPEGIQLIFVGPPGDGHARFLAHLNRLDAGREQVRYLGRVEEGVLAALYQECLAVVLPSRFEGFGFPVLEAMGHRVPVLCSNAGSLPEVAGEAALLFDSESADDLGAKLLRLAADGDLRTQLVARGQAQLSKFSWEKCARGMVSAFAAATRPPAVSGHRPSVTGR